MVGGAGNIGTDDGGGPSQPVPAPVVAATTTGDATGSPLHNLNDIRAAVQAVANSVPDTAPMIQMFEDMSQELCSLSLEQRITIFRLRMKILWEPESQRTSLHGFILCHKH